MQLNSLLGLLPKTRQLCQIQQQPCGALQSSTYRVMLPKSFWNYLQLSVGGSNSKPAVKAQQPHTVRPFKYCSLGVHREQWAGMQVFENSVTTAWTLQRTSDPSLRSGTSTAVRVPMYLCTSELYTPLHCPIHAHNDDSELLVSLMIVAAAAILPPTSNCHSKFSTCCMWPAGAAWW